MLNNKIIFLTGGTGSFGNAFVSLTLKHFNPKKIIIFSRDEMKQWEMAIKYKDDKRIQFVIGDVRDKERLFRSMNKVDYVVHAAATKIVPIAELNPTECIKTNILGGMNVIEAAIDNNVERVVALSTDKASNPINLYGASKLASDKLFLASNLYGENNNNFTRFSVVRYGNVMGSRGSVIPFFLSLAEKNNFPITDLEMTRFMITLEDSVELVWHAIKDMFGGEIYVKKIPSMKVLDIAKSINPKASHNFVGIRPGEKIHEQMIGVEDSRFTYEYDKYYKILPSFNNWFGDEKRIGNGIKVIEDFSYTSDKNLDWLTITQLTNWISKNKDYIGKI